jgi:hypothetical protein
MRLKPKEPGLKKRILEYGLALPSNYKVSPVLEAMDTKTQLSNLANLLYPLGIRPDPDEIENWLDDISTMGYLISNSQYPANRGTVAAVLLGYDNSKNDYYHVCAMNGQIPHHRREEYRIYYEVGNQETAYLWLAGVLPGDPHAAQIREGLVAMQNYLMWEGCFREIICTLSEHDPMAQVYQKRGYTQMDHGSCGDGDMILYLTQDRITLNQYFQSLSALVGKEWLKDYLGIDAEPQEDRAG